MTYISYTRDILDIPHDIQVILGAYPSSYISKAHGDPRYMYHTGYHELYHELYFKHSLKDHVSNFELHVGHGPLLSDITKRTCFKL